MSAHALTESERLRASFASRTAPMVSRERSAELIVGAAFLLAALALVLFGAHPSSVSLSIAAMYVLALALTSDLRFDIGAGFTVPTQVVFVPMLFALPVALVPLLVALSLALAIAPAIVRGRVPLSRLLTVPANSCFALGPALVLSLAHVERADGEWGVLVLALAAQFACDFVANVVRERLCGGLTVAEYAAEAWPIYLIDLAFTPLGLAVAIAAIDRPWALLLVAPLFGVLRYFSKERRGRLEQLIELNDAYRGTALLLGDVVEADDTYTGEHCKDVVRLALDVAAALGLDAEKRRCVEFGALLHDIGKIAVPKEIVNKPGKLDEREWEIIKTHTVEGQRMLDRVGGFMGKVGRIVRSHHERWDGGGYPDRLSGEEIPLEARIISCCDAFNAMTTTRPYRQAMATSVALAELVKHSGTQFDPQVVATLAGLISTAPDGGAAAVAVLDARP